MKYLAEYRDAELVHSTIAKIKESVSQSWTLMEICGGQTHSIIKNGLDQLLPDEIELVHGPGCPVCVTPLELIDKALAIASQPDVIFTSYGDMLRVPGSQADLFSIRAQGGDVRVVYSPLDALRIAQENPDKEVVFFARVQGFLAAGHVCAVMGYWEYLPIAKKYQIPISVTGFEPLDIVQGILDTVESLEAGESSVKNSYIRAVTEQGNKAAQQSINRVFESCDRKWRGIGVIPGSGWRLNSAYADFDAEQRFNVQAIEAEESPLCISGLVLQGIKKPAECEAFGSLCTPENPAHRKREGN